LPKIWSTTGWITVILWIQKTFYDNKQVATLPEKLQELVKRVEQAGTEFNMYINATKTKVMTNTNSKVTVSVIGSVLEQMKQYSYLGTLMQDDASCSMEFKSRLAVGMNTMIKASKMCKKKSIINSAILSLVELWDGL